MTATTNAQRIARGRTEDPAPLCVDNVWTMT